MEVYEAKATVGFNSPEQEVLFPPRKIPGSQL
jgi:hypothetical protein